jgi:type III restriction enzyme
MPGPVVIENPILNSPFEEPARHFRYEGNRITGEVADGRRESSYFIPVAAPKKATKSQNLYDDLLAAEKKAENDHINRIRREVKLWRDRGRPDVTAVTRGLFDHWTRPDRERRLFFCQVEALETLVFVTEVAKQTKYGQDWIEKHLRDRAAEAGTTLFRLACKMATGSGKTVVMSMVIAWHTLNKRQYPKDNRFSDSFLVATPGITIRDRLRVLLPADEDNYYRKLDLVPADAVAELGRAKIVISNFHAFKLREKGDAGGLTKRILTAKNPGAFTESPGEMVRRVCRELGTQREVVVLNDEAHHCYRGRPATEKLTGEDKKEAERREEEARLWITGLEAVHAKVGVKAVFDLSATPFYLKGSGYPEGTLFPWVVSDFSLIDAIESGIVKVPRVPVADNAMTGDYPKYRDLWVHIRDGLPRKGRGTEAVTGPPVIPQELQGAAESLYAHYEVQYRAWEADQEGRDAGRTPPVFIVVCQNTNISKLVYDYLAGHETGHAHPDGSPVVAAGKFPIFSNVEGQRWLARPNTILVDSEQFESEDGMSPEFKKLAAHQIEEFKAEYRQRFPGRDADALTDQDLMREVMNTVGKAGKLGGDVRCVVSVSMLTEGWDANTVTHILGVRAFGTQLLCEQVVGRGLRRMSYALNPDGHFDPEYAEVFGVPFAFLPCAGAVEGRAPPTPRPGKKVHACPERLVGRPWLEVRFPRVAGYHYEVPPENLGATFDASSRVALSTQDTPTRTENAPIIGQTVYHTLDKLKAVRPQTVTFHLATHLQQHQFKDRPWLFPQLLAIVRRWMDGGYVDYGDDTFPGLLLFAQRANEAAEKIYKAVVAGSGGDKRLRADLQPYDQVGTTATVAYDTVKTTWQTSPARCHLNLVPEDSSWETQLVQKLEDDDMAEVVAYVKNQNLGFKIPYTHEGRPANYYPDYILKVDDGRMRDPDDHLHLIVEVSGQDLAQKEAKVETAKTLWVPAVNNEGRFGRWAFLEIVNTAKAKQAIKQFLKSLSAQ